MINFAGLFYFSIDKLPTSCHHHFMTSNDLESKRKRIETWTKIIIFCVAGALFAPFALMTIKGLISLIVVGVIGFGMTTVGIPWLGASFANWRLKALKAVAAANPIEQLENTQKLKTETLTASRENIKKRIAIASDIFTQITDFEKEFNKPSPFRAKYVSMMRLIEMAKTKYKAAQKSLVEYSQFVDEKRAEWRIVLSMAEADKLDNAGEDFITKMMQDTAVTTINDGLNFAFAELDASVLDAESNKEIYDAQHGTSTATVTVSEVVVPKLLPSPSELDFDFQGSAPKEEAEPVRATRRSRA